MGLDHLSCSAKQLPMQSFAVFHYSYSTLTRQLCTLCTYLGWYVFACIALTFIVHTLHQYALLIVFRLGYSFLPQHWKYAQYGRSLSIDAVRYLCVVSCVAVFLKNSNALELSLDCRLGGLAKMLQEGWMIGEDWGWVRVSMVICVLLAYCWHYSVCALIYK